MALAALICLSAGPPAGAKRDGDPFKLYEQPGRMVTVASGSLSAYCTGSSGPTIVLETGYGGGTAYAWHKLQPLLARFARTCSYDRAGYGFSSLAKDSIRDLNHFVADLHDLLTSLHERQPYVLVGHSNGGLIVGAYADRFPGQVAGLVFLDAAVVLEETPLTLLSAEDEASLGRRLGSIRGCLDRMQSARRAQVPAPHDPCLNSNSFGQLPPRMAAAAFASMSKPDYWRSYLSETENNYRGVLSHQAMELLPHKWRNLAVRVVTADIAQMSDEESAKAYGLSPNDHDALAAARANRVQWETRQSLICEQSTDCEAERIRVADHYVQNAAPEQVAGIIEGLTNSIRSKMRASH